MKISEMIQQLQEIQESQGDILVTYKPPLAEGFGFTPTLNVFGGNYDSPKVGIFMSHENTPLFLDYRQAVKGCNI